MNKQLRATWLRRSEWNFLLLASLCALLAASPAAGASLAASSLAASSLAVSSLTTVSAPQQYKAVLWWLQQHTPVARPAATVLEAVPHASEAQQIAALIVRLQDSLPVVTHTGIELPRTLSNGPTAVSPALLSQAAPSAVATSAVATSAVATFAPRYDASRRLAARSLTAHEATRLCGIRTNRSIE